MSAGVVKAVTFDLWDTVFVDDSDEPRRKDLGLLPKREERRHLVQGFLERHAPISQAAVDLAYDVADAAFHRVWYGQNVTWTVRDRLLVLLDGLKRTLPEQELAELIRMHEEMEINVPPDSVEGVDDAIVTLSTRYRLGVISDTVFSPGWALRRMLEKAGLARAFSVFVFSDEVGCSKPSSELFERAAAQLGVKPTEVVHLGDREEKDIAGAHHVGARGVLITAVKDRGSASTRADAVCDNYRKIEQIIQSLDKP